MFLMDLSRLTVTKVKGQICLNHLLKMNIYFVYPVISFIMFGSVLAVQHICDLYLSEEPYQTKAAWINTSASRWLARVYRSNYLQMWPQAGAFIAAGKWGR